tara:strand:- start:182 stop:796 length:615 start_codon:yes stop_codon:yes gene_type:complete
MFNHNQKIKINYFYFFLIAIFLSGCVGSSSIGVFGSGVSVAIDPRTLGTQIDDSIMQKSIGARLALIDKKYILSVSTKVLDGRIYLSGKVNEPEEKLKITKIAWETDGARSVKNNIRIKGTFSFKNSAKDVLITTQLRAAFILNKEISAANFNLDTINQKIYIFGIAKDKNEVDEIMKESKQIAYVKDVIPSIIFISELSRQKN